ncbi:MAG: hypothetical protein JHC26_09795 [Thermofilum sp.]|jgi:hypothetical protein|uniref:hypothetical protein n=1 Tax=Thermofilum sp. TaxID=1961369 RepID=UPI00258AE666|nr:hypothetical protein [Thermofilum sp.]MCI4409374.1 hypothetical protein [Thermofilum sp.]
MTPKRYKKWYKRPKKEEEEEEWGDEEEETWEEEEEDEEDAKEWEDLLWDEFWGERMDDEKYPDDEDC